MIVDVSFSEFFGGDPEAAEGVVRDAILSCAQALDVPATAVTRVVLASESRYSEALATIDSDSSFTNQEIARGVAKTVFFPELAASAVLVRDDLFLGVLVAASTGEPVEKWRVEDQLAAYVVYHELGHCKDHCIRQPKSAGEPLRGPFRIREVAHYYSDILATEYFACVHSAVTVTAALYEYEAENVRSMTIDTLDELRAAVCGFREGRHDLSYAAFSVAGGVWFILQQFSKLLAFRQGNPALSGLLLPLSALGGVPTEVIRRLELECAGWWQRYPLYPPTPSNELLAVWAELSEACGYRFEAHADGDALWF